MPYCPKCDMEFIEGITTCTDCGGPLFESKEAADKMKKQYLQKQEELLKKQYEQIMAAQAQSEQLAAAQPDAERVRSAAGPSKEYVNMEQKYDDLQSTVTAFLIVGAIAAAVLALSFTGILQLPFSGIMKYIMTGMLLFIAVGSFVIAFTSQKTAKKVKGQISEEENQTKEIVDWFVGKYTASNIDRVIHKHMEDLTPEELSLQRFAIIHDLLITNKDLPDQSYVDALCDMIYVRLFES